MARHYWETTYKFQAQADVPFDYVCGNCGETVSGKRLVALILAYRKTAGKQWRLWISSRSISIWDCDDDDMGGHMWKTDGFVV